MTRKSLSCKTSTLIGKCCRRNFALFTLSMLLQLITMPVYLIMYMQEQIRYADLSLTGQRNAIRDAIRSILLTMSPGTLTLSALAVLSGIALFRYLHVKQQTDFFHALPVTRGQLFVSRFLTGILAVVPAYLISVVLCCGVCVAYGFADAIPVDVLLLSVVVHLAGFLLVYAVSILAAVVSGHTLVSLLVCGWFQFGLYMGYEAVNMLLYVLYPARVYDESASPVWLSPIAEAFAAAEPLSKEWPEKPIRYFEECLPGLLFCLIAAAVVLALAYGLNRIRKNEHAGVSIAFPRMELPFKLYMVSVVAIFCGLIFQSAMTSWTALFVAMAVSALITACVVEIVYHIDFNSLFYRWKSLLVYYVVCAVVLGCMAMDITHWNSSLPERDEIVSAKLMDTDQITWNCGPEDQNDSYTRNRFSNNGFLNSVLYNVFNGLGLGLVEDVGLYDETPIDWLEDDWLKSAEAMDAIYDSASLGAEAMKHGRSTIKDTTDSRVYTVMFTLRNGKTFQRQYFMPEDTKELAENGAKVRFSAEYRQRFTSAALAQTHKEQVAELLVQNFHDLASYDASTIQNAAEIADVLDIVQEESQELTKEYCAEHIPVLVIRAVGKQAAEQWQRNDLLGMCMSANELEDIVDIPVYACETETLAQLKRIISDLTVGFMPEDNISLDITTYDEDGEEKESKTLRYDDEEDVPVIKKWLPHLIPDQVNLLISAVYTIRDSSQPNGFTNVMVYFADGAEISCYCYRNLDEKD